jgi:hypothetical protein
VRKLTNEATVYKPPIWPQTLEEIRPSLRGAKDPQTKDQLSRGTQAGGRIQLVVMIVSIGM